MSKQFGKIKWFDSKKGYGFIIPSAKSESTRDLFFHCTGVALADRQLLLPETYVSYSTFEGKHGIQAKDVKPHMS